jgi:hypothetical protein
MGSSEIKSQLPVEKLKNCCGQDTEMFPDVAAALNGNIETSKI